MYHQCVYSFKWCGFSVLSLSLSQWLCSSFNSKAKRLNQWKKNNSRRIRSIIWYWMDSLYSNSLLLKELNQQNRLLINTGRFPSNTCNMQYHQFFMLYTTKKENEIQMLCRCVPIQNFFFCHFMSPTYFYFFFRICSCRLCVFGYHQAQYVRV